MKDEEPDQGEQERLAALNASLRCELHHCHPQTCGCDYDPITLEEARQIWAEDEAGEGEEGPGLEYYLAIISAVERHHRLHLYRLRSRQLIHEEMTDD